MKYRYLGEPDRPHMVKAYGKTMAVIFRLKNGTEYRLDAPDPTTGFMPGQEIPYDVTDKRVLAAMDADSRFERIGG